MRNLIFNLGALMGAALLLSACQAEDQSTSAPTASALEPASLGLSQTGLDSIQEMMEMAVTERRITAGIAMIAHDGKDTWLGTTGEMEPGIPMSADAILPLASVGKMFTATAAMILCERGAIALDDPVSKFIPEFADVMVGVAGENGAIALVAPETPITIYHLLTHTGGLTVTGDDFWATWDTHAGITTTTLFARALAELPLQSQPGSQFEYGQTGASYEVLAALIEIASNQTLEAFLLENVFDPLDLVDSYFYLPEEKSDRMPAIYTRVNDGLQMDRARGEISPRSEFFHGGGGVWSTSADLLKFARLFLEGGSVDGVRILEASTIEVMMSDQLGDKTPERWKAKSLSWGFGAAVEYSEDEAGSKVLAKYGWVGGGFARLWIDPEERLIAYFNFPLTPPGDNDLLAEFEERVYAALTDSDPSP